MEIDIPDIPDFRLRKDSCGSGCRKEIENNLRVSAMGNRSCYLYSMHTIQEVEVKSNRFHVG